MKTILLIILINTGYIMRTSAQELQSFKLGFGLGYVKSHYAGWTTTGITLMAEPAYRINDKVALGLRVGFADIDFDIVFGGTPIGSYTMNSQYYFSTGNFRPFAGVGCGLYVPQNNNAQVGCYPRVGFEGNHFFFLMEYNIISGSGEHEDYHSIENYFGVTIGLNAWGSRKKTTPLEI